MKDKSREISGYCARNRGIAEPRKKLAAGGGAVRRNAVFYDAKGSDYRFCDEIDRVGGGSGLHRTSSATVKVLEILTLQVLNSSALSRS